MHWVIQRLVETQITYDFTLHLRIRDHTTWCWRCRVDNLWTLFFWALTIISWSRVFARARSGPKLATIRLSGRGDFWASQPVEIQVFASPTGYMLTSSGFPVLKWGIFYKFLWFFSAVINFSRLFLKLNRFICNQLPVLHDHRFECLFLKIKAWLYIR